MNRASPIDTRRALEAANAYAKAGIPFVPVPVLNFKQKAEAGVLATQRLEQIEKELES
jgi:3-hydroxyisobutyrate dehydrogenase-like beta-hydroxyacid dehydrogenase